MGRGRGRGWRTEEHRGYSVPLLGSKQPCRYQDRSRARPRGELSLEQAQSGSGIPMFCWDSLPAERCPPFPKQPCWAGPQRTEGHSVLPRQGHKVLRWLSASAAPLCLHRAQWDVSATKNRCPQASASDADRAASREAAQLPVFLRTPLFWLQDQREGCRAFRPQELCPAGGPVASRTALGTDDTTGHFPPYLAGGAKSLPSALTPPYPSLPPS